MQKYTQTELNSFEKAKLEMYQGTLAVCFVYGTIAIILIILVLFTEVGREYLYHKMLPATMTFIIGALIIIFYLVFTIYELKPRQRRVNIDVDDDIICPDYWKLKRTDESVKKELVDNNRKAGLFNDITSVNDGVLNYTCEYNAEVYGDIKSYAETKNKIKDKASFYKSAIKYNDKATSNISYLYIENLNPANLNDSTIISYNDDMLGKYAQFSGIYVSGQKTTDGLYKGGTSVFRREGNYNNSNITANTIFPLDNSQADLEFYYNTKPLICNTVYPQILAKLDKNTPEQNKYRCAYAKACDIAWTDIGCE